MGGLVEDLLLLAELDRGRPLRAEPVDLQRICADAVGDSNAVAHGHHLTLEPGPPVVVLGDAERLAQVAHNLVRNALAHTPPGTEVSVSTGVAHAHGRTSRCPTTGPASRPARPPGSSTASTRATRRARPRAPGWAWPSCGPSPRHCAGRPRCVPTPGRGATLVVRIPLAASARRGGGARDAHAGPLTAAALSAPGTTASRTVASLTFGLGRLGLGVRAGHDARAGAERDAPCRRRGAVRCGCRSSTRRRRRRRPIRPARPSSRGRRPRRRAMKASASARGVPPTAGVGWRRSSSVEHRRRGRARRPSIRVPRWATERKATREGSSGTARSAQNGAQRGGDVVDHVAVLLPALGRPGQVALGVGVGSCGLAPRRTVPARGWHGDARAVAGHQQLGAGAEEGAVGHRHGEDGAVGLAGAQPAQHRGEGERARPSSTVTRPRQHHLAQRRPRARACAATASATRSRVGRPRSRAVVRRGDAGRPPGPSGVGAVLPDHGVEELVGPGERRRRPARPRWPSAG